MDGTTREDFEDPHSHRETGGQDKVSGADRLPFNHQDKHHKDSERGDAVKNPYPFVALSVAKSPLFSSVIMQSFPCRRQVARKSLRDNPLFSFYPETSMHFSL